VPRLRCALILLVALAWNISSPWLVLGRTTAPETTVIASSPHPSAGTEWLPGAPVGEQLARLPGHDATSPALATEAVRLTPICRRPPAHLAPRTAPRDARRRPHMLRGSADPDDPS
jgi:hypothetical protein